MTDNLDFLRSVEIISSDGSTRKMSEEEAQSFGAALESANEKWEKERPAWEALPVSLEKRHPGLKIDHIGGNVPIQGYGVYNGEDFYFRARYQHATLKVGTTHPDPEKLHNSEFDKKNSIISAVMDYPHFIASMKCSDSPYGAGWLTPAKTEVIFTALLSNLVELTHEENLANLKAEKKAWDEFVTKMKAELKDKEVSTDETQ